MKTPLILFICMNSWLLTSCMSDKEAPRVADRGIVSATFSDVQAMLSEETTCEEVTRRFGSPLIQSEGNWGNMMYEMPNKKFLIFSFKGPYITGASYDQIEIKCVQPRTRNMSISFDVKKQKHSLALDGDIFPDISSFMGHLKELPKGSIVEWQSNDCTITKIPEPISTEEERESFRRFCRETGIILLVYPGG